MKKSVKILMLLLSLALIVGALVMVISAEDKGQENVVEYTYVKGGVRYTENGTLAQAFAKVFEMDKGNNSNTVMEINLLGNQRVTGQLYHGGNDKTDANKAIVINLNGYEIDGSKNGSGASFGSTALFKKQFGGLTIQGEGTIKFAGRLGSAMSGAALDFKGTGKGIYIYSSECNQMFEYGGSNPRFNFLNVNVNIDRIIENVDQSPKEGGLFTNAKGTTTKIENSYINFNAVLKTADCKSSNHYLFKLADQNACFEVKNSVLKTTCNGIEIAANATGASKDANGDGATELAGLILNNSKLICQPSVTAIDAVLSSGPSAAVYNHLVRFASKDATAGVYFVNGSYGASVMTVANGFSDATDTSGSVNVYNSTIEHLNIGKTVANAFENQAYVNFYAGSSYIGNGTGFANNTTGNMQGAVKPAADGSTVDFLAGARLDYYDDTIASFIDIPEGCVVALDPDGDRAAPYRVMTEADAAAINFKSSQVINSAEISKNTDTMSPLFVNGGYGVNYNPATLGGKVVILQAGFGKTILLPAPAGSDPSASVGALTPPTVEKNVDAIVFELDVSAGENGKMPTAAFALEVSDSQAVTSSVDLLSVANGDGKLDAGWNRITVVVDVSYSVAETTFAKAYVYISNKLVGEVDLSGKGIATVDGLSMTTTDNSDGATIVMNNLSCTAYAADAAVTTEVADFVTDAYLPSGNIIVSGVVYGTLDEALVAAGEKSSTVIIIGDVLADQDVTVYGFISNCYGYTVNYETDLFELEETVRAFGIKNGNDYVAKLITIDKYAPVTVSWYAGNAKNPMQDTANIKTNQFFMGNTPKAPSTAVVQNVTVGNATLEFAGLWTDVYVCPGDYTTYDAYDKATKDLETAIDAISVEDIVAGGGVRTYYPVYKVKSYTNNYTWLNIDGTVAKTLTSTIAHDGDDPKFDGTLADVKGTVITVSHTGDWVTTVKSEGNIEFAPKIKTTANITAEQAYYRYDPVNSFDIEFYLRDDVHNLLASEDKAQFDGPYTVDNSGHGFYRATVENSVNDAYTEAEFDLKIVDGGFEHIAEYSASLYDYITCVLSDSESQTPEYTAKQHKNVYNMLAYVAAAYDYFGVVDNYNDDFDTLLEKYSALDENVNVMETAPVTDYEELRGEIYITVDLKSSPVVIIGAASDSYAGKIKVNGSELELTEGEVQIECSWYNLASALQIELDGDGDGNYEATGDYSLWDYLMASELQGDNHIAVRTLVEKLIIFASSCEDIAG